MVKAPVDEREKMESCFNNKPVLVEDLKKDLCIEFSALPDSQQEEKEHLEVYLRIRPFTTAESHSGESQDCVNLESPDTVLLKPPNISSRLSDKSVPPTGQRFHFSKVYGPETSQQDLFEGTVKDLVRHVLEGGNSLVFTYGVTNAGKTFTFLGPDGDAGLLPRSLQLVFASVEERVSSLMCVKPQRCREFSRLTREQQAEEALAKRNLLRQLKESEKASASQLCSTSKNSSEGKYYMHVLGSLLEDPVIMDVDPDTSFSIWVSFCEIYNENIHDLLEPGPLGAPRRAALRLSQDVKGNSFVKDLRWVQVNSAEEALKVMKLGRRNQSFSFTKLNQSSSRSHSIFSIRILRVDQSGIPRVHSISELSLCDLAGSERCAKTQNRGERLKEAGNINTSLLTLGKCINALRHNQQAKLLQHVPFRESKLTHYLQSFFCGRGRACMIVNVNQCASMYDETLNVLKFSAVAQKVVVLTTRTLPSMPQRSARELSFLINNADRKALGHRRSSLIGWEHSLEDVQEDDDGDDEDEDEEKSLMEGTMQEDSIEEDDDEDKDKVVVCKKTYQMQVALLKELQAQREEGLEHNTRLEERVREEVSAEFSVLFSEMEADYKERLEREKEILEERAERRLEIFKNLVNRLTSTGPGQEEKDKPVELDVIIDSMSGDLAGIKHAAQATLSCLGDQSPDRLERKLLLLDQQLRESQELLAAKTTGREEAVASLEEERRGREEAVASLEEERRGREEAVASLEEERRGREEAVASLKEERRGREEAVASLEEERRGREEAVASLEEERRGREEAVASLEEERRGREEAVASLEEERRGREEAQRTTEESVCDQLREEILELKRNLSREDEEKKNRMMQMTALEQETSLAKERLVESQREQEKSLAKERLVESQREQEKSLAKERLVESQREQEKSLAKERLVESQREQEKSLAKERLVESQREQQGRHRELLAVAEQTITEKDAELERRGLELHRLREQCMLDADRVKSQDVDLQRRDEDMADLREKLADSKRQIQQVHKEVSSMRAEETALKRKLTDAEKSRKQLQLELSDRDRTILLLRKDQSQQTSQLNRQACQDLETQQRVMEDMRLALSEQEETQQEQEQIIQDLTHELDQLKSLSEDHGNTKDTPTLRLSQSEDLQQARQEVIQAQESLKLCTERQQADRRRWLEEKSLLIGQAKEAEEKRNQEMRKFAEDRERHAKEHIQLESVCAELEAKKQEMEEWRRERDSLVSALEVQLQKLISSHADKEQLIQQLRSDTCPPPEVCVVASTPATTVVVQYTRPTVDPVLQRVDLDVLCSRLREMAALRGSAGFPSVLESSQISTENGRRSRFPKPEMEISFSPLQPNRLALRRQGETDSVTVKITRPARKRTSTELQKRVGHSSEIEGRTQSSEIQDDVEVENKRNTRTKLTPHQEKSPSPGGYHGSQSSMRSRKEGALQKLGGFLQSSPTLFTSNAKKVMSLVSGPSSSSSSSLRIKKSKKKLYQPNISSPMDLPSHTIITEEKDSDHLIIKRRLRARK
ncbi:unnamed protein product [Merluccius merluccius]